MTTVTVLPPGTGESLWFLDTLMQAKVTGEATNGSLAIFEQVAPPGSATPLHRHDATEEHFYLLSGQVTFHDPTGSRNCSPGTFVSVPRGTPHAFRVTGDADARLLVISAPATFEGFVRAVGIPTDTATLPPPVPPSPEAVERLATLGAQHDVKLLGPPPPPA